MPAWRRSRPSRRRSCARCRRARTPPLIIRYNASTVPILQYSISSPKLSEQEIFDVSANQIRVGLATVRGASMPWPYGGKTRVVSVDLDLPALKAKNLAPLDVVNALNAQNLILPSGTAKIGGTEYAVELNASPKVIEELSDLPIKTVNGARHPRPRRGPGARRLPAAAKRRAQRRRARRAAHHL